MVPDPANQHFSPYMAYSNNPIRRVDPDGGTDEDIDPKKAIKQFLKSLPKEQRKQFKEQIKTWQKEIEDFDWANVAFGVEQSLSGNTAGGVFVEGALVTGNVVFLGGQKFNDSQGNIIGDDGGFVYRYKGAEGGAGIQTSLGLEGEFAQAYFIALNHAQTGDHHTFAGPYSYGKGELGVSAGEGLYLGANFQGQVARSKEWTVFSFGMGIAGGLGGTSPVSVSGLGGKGEIQFIDEVGPKKKWQKFWSGHKFLIPFY